MANYVFKQFCGELDEQSLDHLLDIVAKSATQNDELSDDDSDEEESSDGDSADEEAEIEGANDAVESESSDEQWVTWLNHLVYYKSKQRERQFHIIWDRPTVIHFKLSIF